MLKTRSGDGDRFGQYRESLLHLAGAAMPLVPRLAVGAASASLPVGEHVTDLAIKLTEPGVEILRRARYGLRNPVHYLGVDTNHVTLSHNDKVIGYLMLHNSPNQ
jgi:hypothetical protein